MAATSVVSREDIENWASDSPKLYLFRKAVEGMQAISDQALMDERGYQWAAGVHGGFGGTPFCHHGDDHFLTWHRPYVLDMELKLRAQIAKFADEATADEWRLPYWDWGAENVQGIPEAFTAETYDDGGQKRRNPLLSAPYQLPHPVEIDPSDATWRRPGPLPELRELRARVEAAFRETEFHDFSTAIEDPHNRLHRWAGGFMRTWRSAFDPIFWVHHANIDRQFWQWQRGEGHMATVPRVVRDYPCQPFKFKDIRAEAFFDTRALGYTYSAQRHLVLRAEADAAARVDTPLAPLAFDLGEVPGRFARARINVHGVRHPETTCELRFLFAGGEDLLGSYVVLGHGPCPGAPGHCDPDEQTGADLRPPHHLAPFDIFIDVTRAVKEAAGDGPVQLRAEMIVVDGENDRLPTSTVVFDNVSLTLR